jgi:hypothetical protein
MSDWKASSMPPIPTGAEAFSRFAGIGILAILPFAQGSMAKCEDTLMPGVAGCMLLVEDNTVPANVREDRTHLHSTDPRLTYPKTWKRLKIEPGFAAYPNRPPGGERDRKTGRR